MAGRPVLGRPLLDHSVLTDGAGVTGSILSPSVATPNAMSPMRMARISQIGGLHRSSSPLAFGHAGSLLLNTQHTMRYPTRKTGVETGIPPN